MENNEIQKLLGQYNSLYKDMDEVYHTLARHYGLSDCALWILYILRESEDIPTQNKMCEQLSLSKQTVNSALKKLEKEGYIKLEHQEGNQKSKLVFLTARGELFAQKTIDNVLLMEQTAFGQFTAQERITFLQLFQKYACELQREAEKITSKQF